MSMVNEAARRWNEEMGIGRILRTDDALNGPNVGLDFDESFRSFRFENESVRSHARSVMELLLKNKNHKKSVTRKNFRVRENPKNQTLHYV